MKAAVSNGLICLLLCGRAVPRLSQEEQAARDAMEAQKARRTKRALAMQAAKPGGQHKGKGSSRVEDALCFARGYKRVDGAGSVGGAQVGDREGAMRRHARRQRAAQAGCE